MLNIPYQRLLRRYGAACLSNVFQTEAIDRVLAEAACWLVYALRYSRRPQKATAAKAFRALVFSIKESACGHQRGFAVPSKLVGVSNFQDRLIKLKESGQKPELRLTISKDQSSRSCIVAMHNGKCLGFVSDKHDWLVPLVEQGARARVLQVTGDGPEEGQYHGLNVAFTGLADAIRKL